MATTNVGSNIGTSFISGLSSGIDWSSIVTQLIAVDQKSVTLVSNQQSDYQAKLKEWQSFNTQLLTLKTAADALNDPDSFNAFKTVMSTDNSSVQAEDLLSASADTSAAPDSYTVKVVNLATAEKLSSGTFADATAAMGGSYTGDIIINGKTLTVNATDSLNDVANNINKLNAGVTASVLNFSSTDHRLIITSTTTGAQGISITNDLFSWGSHVIIDGQDSTVNIDDVAVHNSSNTIDDVIPGVTLNLLHADNDTTINLNVTRDTDTIKKNIQTFVTDYNNVMSYISKQFSYDTTTKTTGGVLFGDGTLLSVKSDLTSVITQPVWGVNGQFSILGLAGISLDDKGQLSIDDTTLTNYLETNFSDIVSLFAGQGTTSSNSLDYVAHTQNSKAGQYAVHIDTAATRSTSTSDTAVGGTLGSAETMTIKDNITAAISLTAGMTVTDIINAINTAVSMQMLAGSAHLQQNDSNPITSGTNWNNIKDATLQNGDVINFSGTDRNGGSVTGSYTINDVGTDTVQGLLTAIQNAFSNNVTAAIDSSGRIVVTDKSSGTSQLALSITEPSGRGLDFGTVLSTNPGGQTGGQALNVTASNDGSNHVVLTDNSYGSRSFTISEDNHLLWSSDQTVNNGLNVAGTINGEAATGAGQVLTGNTGNANTAGLSVKYLGTDTGDIGTVKLTIGTADLLDRALFNITDPYSGYVSFKETSLQNSIDNFQTRIDQMNAQLDQKKQQMIKSFITMETALSNIQNQSNWLLGQLNAAADGWKSL
ncbi:MAG TPA: flagellar filament capping protein FliD [Syntrophales bacterium]|nr:flagellar filament capping protein FliD [Syntrophales bacterium]